MNNKNYIVELRSWFRLQKRYLDSEKGRGIKIQVQGNSMFPTFKDGEEINIISAKYSEPRIGSILLFMHHEDHATVHRVVGIIKIENKTFYRTKGDANIKKDYYLVPEEEIVGIVDRC